MLLLEMVYCLFFKQFQLLGIFNVYIVEIGSNTIIDCITDEEANTTTRSISMLPNPGITVYRDYIILYSIIHSRFMIINRLNINIVVTDQSNSYLIYIYISFHVYLRRVVDSPIFSQPECY